MLRTVGKWLKRLGFGLILLAVLLALPVLPRVTIAQHAIPPDADSVVIIANRQYRDGVHSDMLQGSQYREVWAQPITVPVLDLDSEEGGLKATREGGGQETRSLHFESASGRHLIFRSVDKEVLRLLKGGLGRSPVAWLVHDQTSSSFPAGALVANPIQAAAGLATGTARLVILPDSERLGEFREKFQGLLGVLQEGPEEYVRQLPRAAEVTEVKDTEEVLPKADSSSAHRLDARSYLTARLVDVFLNDWDRHPGQWRWAPIPEAWGTEWLAIPVDRDQVFSWYDGLLMSLARLRTPKLAEFSAEFPKLRGLMHNSRMLDRRLLGTIERPTWDSIADFVATRLTDSVIAAAVRRMPPPYFAQTGAVIETTLRQRRDGLRAFAVRFYHRIAEDAEIHATTEDETVLLAFEPDGSLQVRVAKGQEDPRQSAWRIRRFDRSETGRVLVFLGGGKDRLLVTGPDDDDAIRVRVYDEGRRWIPEALAKGRSRSGFRAEP